MRGTDDRRAQIRALVIDSLGPESDLPTIDDDAALFDDLGMDSASLLRLVTGLEAAFQIQVEDDELRHDVFQNVSSLDDFVQRKLG